MPWDNGPRVAATPAHVRISSAWPAVVRVGSELVVHGRVSGAAPGTDIALELRSSGRWRIIADEGLLRPGARAGAGTTSHTGAARFALRWRVGGRGFRAIDLRITALNGHRVLAVP